MVNQLLAQEIVNYDMFLRKYLVEKGKMAKDLLPFLLGRSVVLVINQQFGIKVKPKTSS